jgi:putative ABC transport system permease protein
MKNKMIWAVAWRNVWRNKLRSTVILVAVSLGLMAGIFTTAFMKGWMGQRLESVIHTEMSYIQVHDSNFKDNYETDLYIRKADAFMQELLKLYPESKSSKRLVINAMATTTETGTGIILKGIIPETEKEVSNIHELLIDGAYFEGIKRNPAVIGEKLANKLKIGIRDKVILTIQDAQGNITRSKFKVAGIYKTHNSSFDGMNVFVRYQDLQEFLNIKEAYVHEIAVMLSDQDDLDLATEKIAGINPDLLVENWKSLAPELGYMDELMDVYMYIIIIIILFALCFAIINTMLMAVLERIKEIGMLMAVGMNKVRVFSMLILESVFLTLTGGVLGIILGIVFTMLLEKRGLDLSMWAEGLGDMGFAAVIYPELDVNMLIPIIILVILTGLFSALYPAYKALKLNPTEAIRTE